MIVSYFEDVKDTTPKDIELEEWLKDTIAAENDAVMKVLKYRMTKKESDKIKIPCITVSASFKDYRNLDNIKKKNGLLCIDIDRYAKSKHKKSNSCIDMEKAKKLLSEHPCVLYAGYSTGGDGIYAIIRLAYTNKLDEYFEHFQKKFEMLGINIDSSCKDYTRLRFFSYDKDAYFNPDAKYYKIKEKAKEKQPDKASGVKKSDLDKVEKIISVIEENSIDITSIYEDWIKIGGALYGSFGESGRDYFHKISKFHPDYTYKACDIKFTQCKKLGKTNLGSLFFIATNHGVRY